MNTSNRLNATPFVARSISNTKTSMQPLSVGRRYARIKHETASAPNLAKRSSTYSNQVLADTEALRVLDGHATIKKVKFDDSAQQYIGVYTNRSGTKQIVTRYKDSGDIWELQGNDQENLKAG